MLNQLSIFTPLLVFLVIEAISPNKECPCGYGGVCTEVNDIEDCKNLCGIIGKGWYNEDCVTVRNHCEGVLCPRGTCVTTFGGYFCKCPFGFTGVLCDTLWDPKSAQTATAPSNEIYVYYQIQPIPGEMKSFTVIYDVDEQEFEERHTMLTVNISDGRFLYPSVKEMVRRNVYEQCIRETEQYPDLLDSTVCERLPKGSVLSFSFDPSVPKSSYLQDRWVFLPGFEEPIGSVADVMIEVQEPYGNGTYSVITIMKTIYRTFTYYTVSRDPFNCLMNFIFHGCANDGNFPTLHPRGTYIKLFVKQSETNCNGARITGQAWYMQRIKTRKYANNDPVPVLMEEETEEFLLLNPYFSYPGSYMFVVEYTIQGNPPHYGGTTLFRKSVHCFITTVLGNIQFRLQGGSQRTFSCTNPLEIPWENLNPNILLGEMDFSLGCDHLDDPECAPTKTKGYPAIVRNRPGKCFETYNYWIKVRLPGFLTETFNASIRFIHQDVVMGILCAHNCNPVNANDKSIWVAYTEPYITQPVRWSIVVDDVPKDMKYNTQVVRSFYPMSASRILVLTRNVFISSKGYTENLELKVSHGDLVASSSSRIQDIDGYMRLFGVSKEGHLYHYSTSSGKAIRFFNYYVFQLDISTLGAIWIVNSNYIPHLKFNPFWNKVALCGHSYNYYLACTITHDVVANTTDYDNFGVNELAEMLANGRVGLVLRAADYLIWDGVIPRDASGYQWKLSAKERSDILGFVNRVLSVHSLEVDLLTVLHILSIIFYSTGGNVEEDLPYFIDELDLLNTYVTASDWMNVRESASNTLFRVAQVMDYSGQEKGHRNPIDVPFGNVFERFIRVFSLARAQSSMYQHLLHKPFVSYMLRTEITYKYLKDSKLLEKMLILYAKTVANYNVLYYGVTTYGYHHAKLWTINDSYTGLLNALNRSNGYGGLKILQSYESKKSWFSRLQVQLPPTPFVLQYRELALTVVAMKNQLFDVYKSPFLLLLLKTKTGEYLNQLPDNLKYRIVLPLMKNGQILNESTEKTSFVDTIERAESNSDRQSEHFRYKAYKLTFPSLYESFQLTIFIDKPIHSRVKIDLERLPDYDDVMREPILNENKPFRTDKFTYIVKVLPEPGTSALPRSFYFAIIPTDELPIGEKLEISIFTTALLCRTRIIEYNEEGEYCQRIVNETVWDDLNIVCDCKKWGLTAVTEEEIRIVKFLMSDELLLKTFVPPDTFEQVSLESGLILFLPFLALAVANILDRLRRRKQSMIYTKYYFKRSQYPLIIGVYTGHRFGAGTVSSVAVQFVGSYGHSEIILLKRTRSKERKTLRRGHDDWFVVATKEFLGPIQSVYIWSNFRCTSSWYCSRILIFDVTSFRWFTAEVNHWFKFFESNEGSRLAMFEVTEYRFGRNTDIQGFIDHYIIELKNTHHLLSILEMHPRILYTHEQRITIFTVKVLAMLCWIFFVLELLFEQIFGVYYDPEESKELINPRGDTFIVALIVSLLSTLSMIPLETLYRIGHLSALIQKLTTNPLHLDIPKDHLRRETHHDLQSGKNRLSRYSKRSRSQKMEIPLVADVPFKKSMKNKFSTCKGLQAIFLSPCQFYLIDAKTDIIDFKMRRVTLVARCIALFSLFTLFGAVLLILWGTPFIEKAFTSIFLVLITLVVDALIVNPIYALVRSVAMFYLLKVSNEDIALFLDEPKLAFPPPITHLDYVKMVTGKNYKPLLSVEIGRLKQVDRSKKFVVEVLFLILVAAAAVLCIMILLKLSDPSVFYGIRAMSELESRRLHREGGFQWITHGIDQVINLQNAVTYILYNFIMLEYQWYASGKNISEDNRRWARDYNSRPSDAISIIFIFMSNATKLRLPDLYKDFYKTSHGYLSETGSYKWPLILQDNPLQYNEIYSGVLWGNSLENYAFKGHNVTMPWAVLQQSTGSLRFTFDYLYEILDAVPLRALIITANYLNGFTKNVLTVDLLVENLPSGFCSARTKITSSLLEPKSSYLLELLILVLICGLLLVVIFVALYNAYFDDFWKKAISFPIVLVVTGVTYVDFKRRYSIHDKLIFNPADSYLDLHIFHEEGQDANLFLMFIPLLVFLDTLWTIRSVIGTHVFRMKLLSRVHNFVVGYILGNLLWQVVIITVPEKDSRPISVMMEFYYSKSTKSYDLELQSFQIMVVIIAVSIFHKVVMAPVICEYYYTKEAFKIDGDNLFGRIIKNCLKHDKRQKRAEYKNTEPDHKHSVRWFHIHRKVHYIHPKSEFEPTTRTTTTTISTKESIDGLENRSIDRNQHHSSVISSGLLSKLRYLEDNK